MNSKASRPKLERTVRYVNRLCVGGRRIVATAVENRIGFVTQLAFAGADRLM
jgi:hypothetical protein